MGDSQDFSHFIVLLILPNLVNPVKKDGGITPL
jgi:hypothetical protein